MIVNLLISLIVGAISGWLAGKIMNESGSWLKNIILGIIGGVVIGLAGLIDLPLVGLLLSLVGGLLDLYITAGIVLAILVYCKVLK